MADHTIGTVADIPQGTRKIVVLEGIKIGVFNITGKFYAVKNTCPHQGAPLCEGSITGTILPSPPGEYVWGRDNEILRCPWHGWEFDITNGKSHYNPHQCFVKTYEVSIEEEEIDTVTVDTYPVNVEHGKVIVTV
ncbi:Rieske (2Fe-2S) protein [Paenibacillus agricola]|uniref:Rieske (2Fe-2S) protein n=1 Tax=Paenibacillus agricola TaxID=2716264 RepID=A0ABX0JBP4_9BACL|nr:Rieske (2Fe-2S) protein [Paenibacillus agricola]NHN32686.1 Rieske (2Fe-2S) protein [Paenibacillus agricola]